MVWIKKWLFNVMTIETTLSLNRHHLLRTAATCCKGGHGVFWLATFADLLSPNGGSTKPVSGMGASWQFCKPHPPLSQVHNKQPSPSSDH